MICVNYISVKLEGKKKEAQEEEKKVSQIPVMLNLTKFYPLFEKLDFSFLTELQFFILQLIAELQFFMLQLIIQL